MKLIKDCNMTKFLEKVRTCKGEVLFCSPQGDRLNLKSMLTKMILVTLIDDPDYVESGYIECAEKADYDTLAEFLQQ